MNVKNVSNIVSTILITLIHRLGPSYPMCFDGAPVLFLALPGHGILVDQ